MSDMKPKTVSLTGDEREAVLRAVQSRIATLIQLSIKDSTDEIEALDDAIEKLRDK